jgi:hypothetical protein
MMIDNYPSLFSDRRWRVCWLDCRALNAVLPICGTGRGEQLADEMNQSWQPTRCTISLNP